MRKRNLLLVWGMAFCLSLPLLAQPAKLRKAQRQMELLDYPAAVNTYLDILDKAEPPEAIAGIAEAYRKLNEYRDAEYWYGKAIDLPDAPSITRYYLGLMMLRNGKCEQAQEQFKLFLQSKPYDPRRNYLAKPCEYIEELKTLSTEKYLASSLNLNSPYDDLGAAFYADGIVFGSFRSEKGSRQNYMRLYFSRLLPDSTGKGFDCSQATEFTPQNNPEGHQAIVSFSEDQQEIFFTRNRVVLDPLDNQPLGRLEILHARQLGNLKWSNAEPLPFNKEEYSVAHPSLSPNGQKLFFASNMPGGFGGADLYVAARDTAGRWGPPINLGPQINTEGDELYPFYSAGRGLFFSSDGHLGLGGQDIYFASEKPGGEWNTPENYGSPINSEEDDFGLILHKEGQYGFFSSNRVGGQGEDDLYHFRLLSFTDKLVATNFIVLDAVGVPLAGASISSSCESEIIYTDEYGSYEPFLEPEQCCTLRVVADGFDPVIQDICAGESKEIRLNPSSDAEPLVWLRGTVRDVLSKNPIEGALLRLNVMTCNDQPLPVKTGANGAFTIGVTPGCCFKIRTEKTDYFAKVSETEICAAKSGPATPAPLEIFLQPFVVNKENSGATAPAKSKDTGSDFNIGLNTDKNSNAISFLLNLYYDSGRSSVKAESVPELLKLYNLLDENPDLLVEISSHTDARGAAEENLALSQRRAQAIVKWLISKGIAANRLIAKGYGETQLVNGCKDGVPCDEIEHSLNRRTVFKVLGKVALTKNR